MTGTDGDQPVAMTSTASWSEARRSTTTARSATATLQATSAANAGP
jgi:hypothetical protein